MFDFRAEGDEVLAVQLRLERGEDEWRQLWSRSVTD